MITTLHTHSSINRKNAATHARPSSCRPPLGSGVSSPGHDRPGRCWDRIPGAQRYAHTSAPGSTPLTSRRLRRDHGMLAQLRRSRWPSGSRHLRVLPIHVGLLCHGWWSTRFCTWPWSRRSASSWSGTSGCSSLRRACCSTTRLHVDPSWTSTPWSHHRRRSRAEACCRKRVVRFVLNIHPKRVGVQRRLELVDWYEGWSCCRRRRATAADQSGRTSTTPARGLREP